MRIESVFLPEFGLDVTWAMCRNPMCDNFGSPFEGDIPEGKKHVSDARYSVRRARNPRGYLGAEIACRACGQHSRLISNRAIRPIARYFLSLGLPFADCPNEDCSNHGVNLFEHWPLPIEGPGAYRPTGWHTARCNACGTAGIVLGTARRAVDHPKCSVRWRGILDAVQAGRSLAHTLESLNISRATFERHLTRLGRRLNDYHAFRNDRLLGPDAARQHDPVAVHTDAFEVSLRRTPSGAPAWPLRVLVSVVRVRKAVHALAAHPCFLPERLAPENALIDVQRQSR